MSGTRVKLLLVEDDPTLTYVIKDSLQNKGYEVTHCPDGETAWQQFTKRNFDICLLDVMLPKKDGMALAQDIRKQNDKIPILLLTSKNMDDDKIAGFKSGADDYITKPFNMQELLMRLEVFLKRTMRSDDNSPKEFKIGGLDFDFTNLLLSSSTSQHQLTQREADLLRYLCLNANRVLKREEILLNVWGREDYFLGRSMDVFITKVRKYLKGQADVELQTIHGVGFKFVLNNTPKK